MTLNDSDYIVYVVDYDDTAIRGVTVIDDTGFATIYINARLSAFQQRRTMAHELVHIVCDDFYNDDDLDTVENRSTPNETVSFLCLG